MSEMISRRVFLKASGLAALSLAAAGALGGCAGLSPLPGNVTLPSPDDSSYRTIPCSNNYEIAFTSLSDQWESLSIYEKDGKVHRYLYAGLYIKGSYDKFTLNTSNIKCTIGDKAIKVAGLGNVKLNKEATYYEFPSSFEVAAGATKGIPLYLDLGEHSRSALFSSNAVITLKAYGATVTAVYSTLGDSNPSITVV